MKQNHVKLYNLIFPIWLLWLFPIMWLIAMPANFIIDLTVIVLTLKYLKVENIKAIAKSVIFKVWVFGFLADFIGTGIMFAISCIPFDYSTEWGAFLGRTISSLAYNPLENLLSFILVSICVLVTATCIYKFNYHYCLKKANLTEDYKKKLALSLAIWTAPYLFYLPTTWFLW